MPSDVPPFRRTARSLPIALLRARESVMGPIRDMLAQSAITEQKWRVLRVLDESGPCEQTALAQQACLLLPSLTRMLQSMQAEGLVVRAPGDVDRRKSIVSITAAGRAVLRDHAADSAAIFADLESRFGAERLELLLDLLGELAEPPPETPGTGTP